MTKILFSVIFIVAFAMQTNAQCMCENRNVFLPGWYVGANTGANIFLGEGNAFWNPNVPYVFSLKQNTGMLFSVNAGYDFTPVLGLRGSLSYLHHNWPDIRVTEPDGTSQQVAFNAEKLTVDAMFNLSNLIKGYDVVRFMNISAFAGLGVTNRNKGNFSSDYIGPVLQGGVQADFRLSQIISLNVAIQHNFVPDKYNDYVIHTPYDMYTEFKVGLKYKFGE